MISVRNASIDDIPLINNIASVVWPATYSNMMSKEQLDYMFDMMYSPDSIRTQMTEKKHHYFILFENNTPAGYISIHIVENSILYLEKIYVLPSAQGKGFGAILIDAAKDFAATHSLKSIRLNVNRDNKSRHFYEHLGFKIISQRDLHIGYGFYMNDYIMEKQLQNITV
ncbi:MAG: GNAT family N-acetyltransferase [Prevotellaceae bacterium]|jgi:ribosomal protein S18 acetylase RimI-like enzyme|nr:GNAT family N-acetyltransferase [Prevotellaceae bacterium]